MYKHDPLAAASHDAAMTTDGGHSYGAPDGAVGKGGTHLSQRALSRYVSPTFRLIELVRTAGLNGQGGDLEAGGS